MTGTETQFQRVTVDSLYWESEAQNYSREGWDVFQCERHLDAQLITLWMKRQIAEVKRKRITVTVEGES